MKASLYRTQTDYKNSLVLLFLTLFLLPITAPAAPRPELVLQVGEPFSGRQQSFAARAPLLACDVRGGVQIWETHAWQLRRTIRFSHHGVWDQHVFALSPDGRTLAAITADNSLQLWDTRRGTLQRSMAGGYFTRILFTPDGRKVIAGNDQKTGVWDRRAGRREFSLPGSSGLAVSPDSRLLFLNGTGKNAASFWDLRAGKRSHGLRPDLFAPLALYPVAFSPDGRLLATFSENPAWPGPGEGPGGGAPSEAYYAHDLMIAVWDVKTGRRLRRMPGPSSTDIGALQFTSDSRGIVSNDDTQETGGLVLRSVRTGRVLYRVPLSRTGSNRIDFLLFPPDGDTVLAAHSPDNQADAPFSGSRFVITAINARTGAKRRFTKVFFSPTAIEHASTWHPGQPLRLSIPDYVSERAPNDWRYETRATPDGRTLLRQHIDPETHHLVNRVEIVDAASGQVRQTLSDFDLTLGDLSYSPDSALAAGPSKQANSSAPNLVEVWNLNTGKLEHTLQTNEIPAPELFFSPNGKTLAVAARTRQEHPGASSWPEFWYQVQFWAVATGKLQSKIDTEMSTINAPLFSLDGRRLALNRKSPGRAGAPLQIYDLDTERIVGTLPRQTEWETPTEFSPDNARLVTSGLDGQHLWRVHDGRLLATLAAFDAPKGSPPSWIAFTPQGYYVASPGAPPIIRWRIGDKLYPAARFAARFHRPALVQKALMTR